MATLKIQKHYFRRVSVDYQSWDFGTSLEETIEAPNSQVLQERSEKLFDLCKKFTLRDIKQTLPKYEETQI